MGNLWPLAFLAAPIIYGAAHAVERPLVLILTLGLAAWTVLLVRRLVLKGRPAIPTVVVGLIAGISVVDAIFAAEPVGTLFLPHGSTMSAWKRWLAFTARPRGRLIVDAGARRAAAVSTSITYRPSPALFESRAAATSAATLLEGLIAIRQPRRHEARSEVCPYDFQLAPCQIKLGLHLFRSGFVDVAFPRGPLPTSREFFRSGAGRARTERRHNGFGTRGLAL